MHTNHFGTAVLIVKMNVSPCPAVILVIVFLINCLLSGYLPSLLVPLYIYHIHVCYLALPSPPNCM